MNMFASVVICCLLRWSPILCQTIGDFIGNVSDVNMPVNLVIAFDRSASVGKAAFYLQSKRLMSTLMRHYVIVDESCVRMAVITFGRQSRIVFDHISDPITKCELIDLEHKRKVPWDDVTYVMNDDDGCDIAGALSDVTSILDKSLSINPRWTTFIVLLITSGQYDVTSDVMTSLNILREKKVDIYAMSIGNFRSNNITLIAGIGLYASYDDWKLLTTNKTAADIVFSKIIFI